MALHHFETHADRNPGATGLFLLVLYTRICTAAKKRRVGDWVYALTILLGLPLCAGYGMFFFICFSTRKEPRWEW